MNSNNYLKELKSEIKSLKKQLSERVLNDDYRLFFENNEAVILLVDPDNQDIIFANEASCIFYGYSQEQFHKMKISDIHTLTKDEINKKIAGARKVKQNYFIFKHRLSNGEIKDVEVYQTKLRFNNTEVFSLIIFDVTDRINAKIALAESEKRYRDYFDKDISGIYRSTPQGKLLDCNTAFAKMLGYSVKEIKELYTVKLYQNPETRDLLLDNIRNQRNLVNKEIDLITKDGKVIHCMQNVVGVFNDNEELIQFQGYIFNITERRKAIIALEESEARFKRLFEDLGDAVFVTKIGGKDKGKILEVNPSAIKQTGYSKDELLNMNILDDLLVSGSSSATTEVLESQLLKDNIVTTVEQKRRKDGTTFWTEVIVTPIEYEGIHASLSINHDITNRIESNRALEDSERKFRELFEKSGDAFLIIRNRNFVDCNQSAIDMLDYQSKDEFINVHPSLLSPEYQTDGQLSSVKAEEMMDLCIQKGTHRFEWDHMKRNGDIFPVEVLLTGISDSPEDEIIHTVWRDITVRKQNQRDLLIAKEKAEESDRLKSAFLANMSHEIRTPMNGILGFASLLKLPNLNDEQLKQYVSIIENSGKRMLNIINDLMDISKIEAGQMEVTKGRFNVNELIEYLYAFFLPEAEKEELKLTFNCSLPNEEADIHSDNEKLYAILANLLKNSIKYSETGEISFGYDKKGGTLQFYVKDTGVGIPKDRHEAIFDRFVQADIEDSKALEGAGLGLAITKAYIEMLNGKIWLESVENKGTTFYFTIPIKNENQIVPEFADIENNNQSSSATSNNINILIVDDEEYARAFLKIALKGIANKIFIASNGNEAVDICKSEPNIDLVLMDIKMPSMNGHTATREIRKFNKDIIIIAQTAYALAGDSNKAIESGCNDYIAKPIEKDKLIDKIELFFSI